MKILTYTQLKKWKPCNGHDWLAEFKEKYGKSAPMSEIEKTLIKREEWDAIGWIIGKRLEELKKRQICMFAYRCAHRSLKYARKEDLKVLKHAISFAKQYVDTGKVDIEAARSAESAARSAESAARSAAESAVWSAAWSAARSAARSAAESAARSAVWSAESAVWSAARSAAWSAVWSAESAVWSAARSAEYQWQFKQLNDIEDN